MLPVKLAKEPLVDAVFEMRFDSTMPVASIWPGMLFSALPGEKSLESLPPVAIPKEIRDSDPNLAFVPLARLSIDDYWLIIGDRVFAVAAKLPYRGWESFKAAILKSFTIVLNTPFVTSVSRCSIKYVDILSGVPIAPDRCYNLDLQLGGRSTESNDFHVRLGFVDSGITHNLQIASMASTTLAAGDSLNGPLLDVDSVMEMSPEAPLDFLAQLGDRAQALHDSNKQLVFDCLSAEALEYLEPTYE
jgi:uncharacterized protein (TIGR04255 family)